MKVLEGKHISPETAYVVNDYPYGFHLRCKARYWIEFKPKKGFRLMFQTTNPKRRDAEVWNKPKAGTYAAFGGALYVNDEEHVRFAALTEYSTLAEAEHFQVDFGEGVPEAGKELLEYWIKAKRRYEAAKKERQQENNS